MRSLKGSEEVLPACELAQLPKQQRLRSQVHVQSMHHGRKTNRPEWSKSGSRPLDIKLGGEPVS